MRQILKYTLAAFGGWLLFMLFYQRWGLATTIWFLGFPFVYGVWLELTARRRPPH